MLRNVVKRVMHVINQFVSKIQWNPIRALFNGGIYYDLTEEDHNKLRRLLSTGNYIILTYRKSHLTTWLIGILTFLKLRKWPGYVHASMNVDNLTDPADWLNYKIMEATGKGVHWSSFMQVFDCDAVCILQPKSFTQEDWTIVMEKLLAQEGKQYDDLFDLADDQQVSCVELCRVALQADPTYNVKFANFEEMITTNKNLIPQMFRDCADFDILLEIKRV